jgi:hypothetical protein
MIRHTKKLFITNQQELWIAYIGAENLPLNSELFCVTYLMKPHLLSVSLTAKHQ